MANETEMNIDYEKLRKACERVCENSFSSASFKCINDE